MNNLTEKAREIIDTTNFLSLATSNGKETWIAPLFFAHDQYKTLHFVSSLDSVHVQHIRVQSQVAVSIFNSNQKEGNLATDTNGVQIRGHAFLAEKSEYAKIITLLNEKIWPGEKHPVVVTKYDLTPRRIFTIQIDKIYIQDPEHFQKYHIDKRVEVDL
jgi:general stress protein 26